MSRHPRARLLVLFAVACLSLLGALPADAITGWRGPTTILADHRVLALRMGVDAQGHTMIVAQDATGLFYLSDRSGTWRIVRLPVGPLDAWEPDWTAVFSRDGVVHVVWTERCTSAAEGDPDCSGAGLWYLTNAAGGPRSGWPATGTLLVIGTSLWTPGIQVRSGRHHLVYGDGDGDLHYRSDASGSWVDRTVATAGTSISVTLGGDGRVHLLAQEFSRCGASQWIRVGGAAASPTFTRRCVRGPGDFDSDNSLVVDSAGHARVGWSSHNGCGAGPCPPVETDGAWYVRWTGSAWATPVQLSRHDLAGLRIDARDRVTVLTDRPGVVRPGGSERRLATARNASGTVVVALALAADGKARVAWADVTVTADGRHWDLFLARER